MNVVILVVSLALYPWLPSIVAGEFETKGDCMKAAAALDQSAPLLLRMTCEVRT